MKLTKKRLNQIIAEEKVRLDEAPKTPDEMFEMARQRIIIAMEKLEVDDHVGVLRALEEALGLMNHAHTKKMHGK